MNYSVIHPSSLQFKFHFLSKYFFLQNNKWHQYYNYFQPFIACCFLCTDSDPFASITEDSGTSKEMDFILCYSPVIRRNHILGRGKCKQLLEDFRDKRGYRTLKEKALDYTLWRTCFGRGYGPVIRQTTE